MQYPLFPTRPSIPNTLKMIDFIKPKALFAAFDLFPSSKGAATHIHHSILALSQFAENTHVFVLGNENLPCFQEEGSIKIHRFNELITNYIERALAYASELEQIIKNTTFEICHFRDIWSGMAIFSEPHIYKTVFEVNALPSVELLYKYPALSSSTQNKIISIENLCLEKADTIVVPSKTIKNFLIKKHVAENKIIVIPNGADLPNSPKPPRPIKETYIIYFGALQTWQGVDDLIRAFALLRDYENLRLVICSSNQPRYSKIYTKLAEKCNVADRIIWNHQLAKIELNQWIAHALLSVAPLKATSRNIEQGCCPLKILESMAQGIPVIASSIPSVIEIINDNVNGIIVQPDRPSELARKIRFLIDFPEQLVTIGQKGQETIKKNYTWEKNYQKLFEVYSKIYTFTEK